MESSREDLRLFRRKLTSWFLINTCSQPTDNLRMFWTHLLNLMQNSHAIERRKIERLPCSSWRGHEFVKLFFYFLAPNFIPYWNLTSRPFTFIALSADFKNEPTFHRSSSRKKSCIVALYIIYARVHRKHDSFGLKAIYIKVYINNLVSQELCANDVGECLNISSNWIAEKLHKTT